MASAEPSHGGERCRLDVPYLLALDTPVHRAADGSYWAGSSWARDLAVHMTYLPQLTMLGVVIEGKLPPDAVRLPDLGTRFVATRRKYGRMPFYLGLPRMILTMFREVRKARIVHSSLAYGEALPYGWIVFPIARAMRRITVVTIEGSFWRLYPGQQAGLKRRFEAWASERINRGLIRHIDYVSYQHEQYRRTLPAPRAEGGVLAQASWVDAEDVVDIAALDARWARRAREATVRRAVFAGRMLTEKGTRILAQAIELLAHSGADLDLDIIGEGPDLDVLAACAGRRIGRGTVRLHEPVPYGRPFFDYLAGFDLLLVPSLADEQPRIVYDAGAQGVPAIVSDTPGLLSCVRPDESAIVVPRNDPARLAEAIAAAVADPALLMRLGRGARQHTLANTHQRMHQERCRDIRKLLDQRPQ